MKKIIDFILIFLLSFFIISIFNSRGDKKENTNGSLLITMTESIYKVPNFPVFNIKNFTDKDVVIDLCNDLIIKSNGEKINYKVDDCSLKNISSGEKTTIDLSNSNNTFINEGSYFIELKVGDKEYNTNFEVKNRGSLSKIFLYIFYAPIYNLMAYLLLVSSYSLGLSIIFITIIVRFALIYPQHKMMVNQQKMQSLQPKIKLIQEKHKGNQAVLGQELLALYKKEGVNPVGSCGFLLIQMPILIVIYNVIRYITDESNYFYVYSFLSNFKIENINPMFLDIDLLKSGGVVGVILAITVAVLQYFQVKLSLKNNKQITKKGTVLEKKNDSIQSMMPDPEMMNKFMLYGMPAMVGIFTYTFFAGLGFYWGMTTLFMIVQQLIVNKIRKKSS